MNGKESDDKNKANIEFSFSTGRSEPGLVPSIVGFTKDSVAQESDRLAPGDRICSVNGISTARLTNDEVLRLLDNVEERASLEVEYYMPNYGKSLLSNKVFLMSVLLIQ